MKKTIYLLLALLTLACSDHLEDAHTPPASTETAAVAKDKISAKLNADIVARIDNRRTYLSVPTGDNELDGYLQNMGATRISRIFPHAGKDEPRQQQAGLNRWYTIWLSMPKSRSGRPTAALDVAKARGIDNIASYAEPVFLPQPSAATYTPLSLPPDSTSKAADTGIDPLYCRQWNLCNNGTTGKTTAPDGTISYSSRRGADINIEPAWALTTGDPDVVVAVVDGGIDTAHPDLQDAMWVNEGEIPDNGIDDDNNGFVDDYHGYNFCDDTCRIVPTRHGTHVAGIIAARRHNGIGIAGVAGGDGSNKTGVRLMSCQIFKPNPNFDPTDPESTETVGTADRNLDAAAIVYGANNGALISQNSWGFSTTYKATPKVISEAIAYFNQHAGGSKTNKPLMQGGVVIFAAGNDATSRPSYPAADDLVISVGAFNPDFQAAWYTNYGSTVDLSAPGGTKPVGGRYPAENGLSTSAILSTVPGKNGKPGGYAYMQGTSMACPHVSAIAALIVSHYGGAGFTADRLRRQLLAGVKKMAYNDYVSPPYRDRMGLGYVDAFEALRISGEAKEPTAPMFLPEKTKPGYADLTVAWTSANCGSNGSLQYYLLYYATTPITEENRHRAACERIPAQYAEANEIFERTCKNLKTNTTYYFAVRAVSRNGHHSPLTTAKQGVTTLNNHPPQIEPLFSEKRITMAGKDVRTLRFRITDPENHRLTYRLIDTGIVETKTEGEIMTITIHADKYIPGIYPFRIKVTDECGAEASAQVVLEIVQDNLPTLTPAGTCLSVRKGDRRVFRLKDLLEDEQPDRLVCRAQGGAKTSVRVEAGRLVVTGREWGEDQITLTATDIHGQTATLRLPVFVYDNDGIYALYPTRTTSLLRLRVGDAIDGDFTIIVGNATGGQALTRTCHTKDLDTAKRTLVLDVSSLAPGYYILSLRHRGKTYQSKFVKE